MIAIRVNEDLKQKIDVAAELANKSKTDFLRDIIENYMEIYKEDFNIDKKIFEISCFLQDENKFISRDKRRELNKELDFYKKLKLLSN